MDSTKTDAYGKTAHVLADRFKQHAETSNELFHDRIAVTLKPGPPDYSKSLNGHISMMTSNSELQDWYMRLSDHMRELPSGQHLRRGSTPWLTGAHASCAGGFNKVEIGHRLRQSRSPPPRRQGWPE